MKLICTITSELYISVLEYEATNGSSNVIDDIKFLTEKAMFKNKYSVNLLANLSRVINGTIIDQYTIYQDGVNYAEGLKNGTEKIDTSHIMMPEKVHVAPGRDPSMFLSHVYALIFKKSGQLDKDHSTLTQYVLSAYSMAMRIEKKVTEYLSDIKPENQKKIANVMKEVGMDKHYTVDAGLEWMRNWGSMEMERLFEQ